MGRLTETLIKGQASLALAQLCSKHNNLKPSLSFSLATATDTIGYKMEQNTVGWPALNDNKERLKYAA